MKIGNIEFNNPIILAPMESVTDLPFRVICRRMGADLVVTEFIASDALVREVQKSFEKMQFVEEERPIAVQIFGGNRDAMVESAKIVEDSGADILDINMGCWVKKVVNHNAGAAMLKDTEKMAEMAEAVVNAVSMPVTVKTRLGWDKNSIVIEKAATLLEQAGIAALTVHCRTRQDGMTGEADWNWLPKVKEKINIPVFLNGDILSPEDVQKAFLMTGCDGAMIARGAIGNPFIFSQTKKFLKDGFYASVTPEMRINVCLEHLDLTIQYKGLERGLHEFRKHYSGYFKGLNNCSKIRQILVTLENYEGIKSTLFNYLDFLLNHQESQNQLNEDFDVVENPPRLDLMTA